MFFYCTWFIWETYPIWCAPKKEPTWLASFRNLLKSSFHIMLLILSHLKGDRDRGRQWLRARRRCILNTFGRCSPGEGSTAQMLEWNVCFVTRTSGSCSIVQCSLLMEIEFLYSFFSTKKIKQLFSTKKNYTCFCTASFASVLYGSVMWSQTASEDNLINRVSFSSVFCRENTATDICGNQWMVFVGI